MLANGKIHAGKQSTYTQLDIRKALWRVFKLVGRCGVRDYRANRLPGEPSADGILYRCHGKWNWLLASFEIPTQAVGRPIKMSRGICKSRPLRKRQVATPKKEPLPIAQPKERPCLGCRELIVSVQYTCEACRERNTAASTGSYL